MAARSGIYFTLDTLTPSVNKFGAALATTVWTVLSYEAPRVQAHMQSNAPWQDQTGNARQGLKARPSRDGGSYAIDLFHTMPYGIWLETRWSGRYAIIKPTIIEYGPKVMRTLQGAMGRMT